MAIFGYRFWLQDKSKGVGGWLGEDSLRTKNMSKWSLWANHVAGSLSAASSRDRAAC